MTWTIRKAARAATLSLATLLAFLVSGILPLNLFFLKSALSEFVLERSGATLSIEGPLRLRLGPRPTLTARGVRIGLPQFSQKPSASIQHVSVAAGLLNILRGDIDLREMSALGIVVDPGLADRPDFIPGSLKMTAAAPLGKPLTLDVEDESGKYGISFSLSSGSLDELLEAPQELPLSFQIGTAASSLAFAGAIHQLREAPRLSGNITADTGDLSSLIDRFGWDLPGLGPFQARSGLQLSRAAVEFDGLTGELNGLPFTVSAAARGLDTRPTVELSAHFPWIDPAALPLSGRDPSSSDTIGAVNLQPLFDSLALVDGTAAIKIDEFRHATLPAQGVVVQAILERGLLTIEEFAGAVSESRFSARASLETTAPCASLKTSVDFSGIEPVMLSALLPRGSDIDIMVGRGRTETQSCGASLADHLYSLQSVIQLARLEASTPQRQESLLLEDIDAQINWQEAGRISFRSAAMDLPLAVSLEFGSVTQLTSDELWPLELYAEGSGLRLGLSGETALRESGLFLDLLLDARLGESDISGPMTWTGVGAGLPLKAHLRSSLLDLEDIAVFKQKNGQSETYAGRDWSRLLDDIDLLEKWLNVPSFDLMLSVQQLQGTPFQIRNVDLDARLDDRLVKDARMRLEFEGIEMQGALNADLRKPSRKFDYEVSLQNVDLNRLSRSLDLSRSIDARADRVDIRFESEGATLRSLGQNMRVDSKLWSLQWFFTAGPEDRPFEIDLSHLRFTARPGSDTVWQTAGTLNGSPIRAWMKTPDVRDTFDIARPLPFRLAMGAGDDILVVEAVVQPLSEQRILARLDISGRYTNGGSVDLSTLPSTLEDFDVSAELMIEDRAYHATEVEARIGSTIATGTFSISPRVRGFHFDLDVASPLLETDDLVRLMQEIREVGQNIAMQEEEEIPDSAQPRAGLLSLLNQYLEEFVGENSWNVQAGVKELRSSGHLLGEARFELTMDEEAVVLDPFSIRLPGGNVDARYSSRMVDSGWDYDMDVFIERLEYGGLLRLLDPESKASGEVFLEASLHSSSANFDEAISHLRGHVDMALFPDDVNAQILDLWASNLVLALLPLGETQNKKMNCMVARFEVEGGVMKSRKTFLDSTDIIVRTTGDIDLAKGELDLLAIPQAKVERFLSVSMPLEVTGPFDDFEVSVAKGGFLMTMIRWYYGLIYVPWKWLTGERFPADGIATCYHAMDWETPAEAR